MITLGFLALGIVLLGFAAVIYAVNLVDARIDEMGDPYGDVVRVQEEGR